MDNSSTAFSLTHETNQYHLTTSSSAIRSWFGVSPVSLSTNDNWIVEIVSKTTGDFNLASWATGTSTFLGFMTYNNSSGVYGYGSPNDWIVSTTSTNTPNNNYYRKQIKLYNGAISFKVYDLNDNVLYSVQFNLPSQYQNKTIYPCVCGYGNNTTNKTASWFKEFKVELL